MLKIPLVQHNPVYPHGVSYPKPHELPIEEVVFSITCSELDNNIKTFFSSPLLER